MSDRGIVLVTGGAGHLGANLVRRLLADGERVRALQRPGSDNRALDGLALERVDGDLRDPAAVARAVAGVERVYHCAAKLATVAGGEREVYDCNVLGTRNLLAAARKAGVRRVVVTGSFSATGHLEERPSDESVPYYPFKEALPYERTKVLVEHETLKACADGLDALIATSCAIVGPHDFKPSRMGQALLDFAHGKLRAYIPGGFEFVTARDIVAGHVLAMAKGRAGQKYIFASGYMNLDQLMAIYEELTGVPKPRLRLSPSVMMGIARVVSPVMARLRPNDPQRFTPAAVRLLQMGRRADTTKAQTELGFRPTPVRDALAEAYDDFVRRGVIANPKRPVSFVVPTPPPVEGARPVAAVTAAGDDRRQNGVQP